MKNHREVPDNAIGVSGIIKKGRGITMTELSRTRWVTLNGSPAKVSDLPDNYKRALGNRVRTEPIRSLGLTIIIGGQAQ